MKKITLMLIIVFAMTEGLLASEIMLINKKHEADNLVMQVRIQPPETVDRVLYQEGNVSKELPFKTNISTDVYLLIDTSIPMKRAFRKGIRPLIEQMEQNKQTNENWIVTHFDSDLVTIYDDRKKPEASASEALKKVKVRGQRTEMWRSVQAALKTLAGQQGLKKVLILFSDGKAEDTTAYTLKETIALANKEHIAIVALAYRDTMGTQNMRKLAEETTGIFLQADKRYHLPSNWKNQLDRLIASEGLLTIKKSWIPSATPDGKMDARLVFEHGTAQTTFPVKIETETIQTDNKTPTPVPFWKQRKNQWIALAALGVLLIILWLLWLLRRKKIRKHEEAKRQEALQREQASQKAISDNEPTKMQPKPALPVPIAFFESMDGQKYPIYKFPTTIGKSSTNDLVIPGKYISRQHATISQKDGRFYIVDNGSSNGVLVEGKRIEKQHQIRDNKRVAFGPFETVFRLA